MYKCSIQTCTYGGGEWCQKSLLTKPRKKIEKQVFFFMACIFVMTCHKKLKFATP